MSAEERAWLDEHPVIRVAPDPDFAPFEWFTLDGEYKGMAADYLAAIEQRLDVNFEIVHARDWSTVLDLARRGDVDLLPAAARSSQRDEFLLFTRPHIVVPGVIIASRTIEKIEDLKGRRVAVVVDYIWDDLLTHHDTDVRLVRVEDTKTGLELASLGAVDALVSDLASVTHIIGQEGITNLQVVEHLERNLELGMAVRKDWSPLRDILDKALASLTDAEREAIRRRWLRLTDIGFWQEPMFWYSLGGSVLMLLLALMGFVVWNRALTRQVAVRTRELEDIQGKLMQAEKMESIGRLAAGVAHEVKNPLAIIQMGTDYLSGELDGAAGESGESGAVLKDMDDAVQRADRVIRGLLDFSREGKLEPVPGRINDVIDRSLHLVEHEMRRRNIEVAADLSSDLPDLLMDANKLQQVFINLFMNAAHAMDRGGRLTVTTSLHRVSNPQELRQDHEGILKPGDEVVRVEVADDGPGIRPEHLTKLFDPFFTTKPVGEGTGLGLSVSRKLVSLHNGVMSMGNRPQGGASVVMLFKLENREST